MGEHRKHTFTRREKRKRRCLAVIGGSRGAGRKIRARRGRRGRLARKEKMDRTVRGRRGCRFTQVMFLFFYC